MREADAAFTTNVCHRESRKYFVRDLTHHDLVLDPRRGELPLTKVFSHSFQQWCFTLYSVLRGFAHKGARLSSHLTDYSRYLHLVSFVKYSLQCRQGLLLKGRKGLEAVYELREQARELLGHILTHICIGFLSAA